MATQDILNERQKTHGSFHTNAMFSRALKDTMRDAPNWPSLSPVQKEALDVIQAKIARILSGNPNEPDHWADIAGYAELAKQDLEILKPGLKPKDPDARCLSTVHEGLGEPMLYSREDFGVPKPRDPIFCNCVHCAALRAGKAAVIHHERCPCDACNERGFGYAVRHADNCQCPDCEEERNARKKD